MSSRLIRSIALIAVAGFVASATVHAQDRKSCERDYKPQVGPVGQGRGLGTDTR